MQMYQYPSYMYHYGIKGMKWGVRRYRNPDGTLTPAGKKRNQKSLAKKIKKAKSKEEIVSILDKNDTIQNTKRSIHSNKKLKKLKNKWYDSMDAVEAQWDKEYPTLYKKAQKDVDKWWDSDGIGPKDVDNHQYDKAIGYAMDAYPSSKKYKQLEKAEDAAWEAYNKELKSLTKSGESLLGKYGDRPLKTLPIAGGYETANQFIQSYLER